MHSDLVVDGGSLQLTGDRYRDDHRPWLAKLGAQVDSYLLAIALGDLVFVLGELRPSPGQCPAAPAVGGTVNRNDVRMKMRIATRVSSLVIRVVSCSSRYGFNVARDSRPKDVAGRRCSWQSEAVRRCRG